MSAEDKVLETFIDDSSILQPPPKFEDASEAFGSPCPDPRPSHIPETFSEALLRKSKEASLKEATTHENAEVLENEEPSTAVPSRVRVSEPEDKENQPLTRTGSRESENVTPRTGHSTPRSNKATPLSDVSFNSQGTAVDQTPKAFADYSAKDDNVLLSSVELGSGSSTPEEVVQYGSPVDSDHDELSRVNTLPTITADSNGSTIPSDADFDAVETSPCSFSRSCTPLPEEEGVGTTPSDIDTDLKSHPTASPGPIKQFPDLGPMKATPIYKSSGQRKLRIVEPKRESLKTPLEIDPAMMARVESLGTNMLQIQRRFLWTGILLDFMSKVSLARELARFGNEKDWVWFSFVLLFFLVSGFATTTYWLTHYPKPKPNDPNKFEAKIFGYTKNDFKKMVRNFGAVCAFFQLGTAFAAARALRTRESQQRKAEMDLRGMRLVDTVFLTLSVASLQVYIGIRCSSPEVTCEKRDGFDLWLFSSIMSSVVSAALCYLSLDLQDRWVTDTKHFIEMICVCFYKIFELAARVVTVGLFAATRGPWVFLLFAMHAICVTAMLYWPGNPSASSSHSSWQKIMRTQQFKLLRTTISTPAIDDVKLLWACLAWPPSCFVSDATDGSGKFWWRVRMCPRKPFSGLALEHAIIPFPYFTLLMATEMAIMLSCIAANTPHYFDIYVGFASVATVMWLVSAVMWISYIYILCPGEAAQHRESTSTVASDLPTFVIHTPLPRHGDQAAAEAGQDTPQPDGTVLSEAMASVVRASHLAVGESNEGLELPVEMLDHNKLIVEVVPIDGTNNPGASNKRYRAVEPSPAPVNSTAHHSTIVDPDRQFLSVPVGFSFDFDSEKRNARGNSDGT